MLLPLEVGVLALTQLELLGVLGVWGTQPGVFTEQVEAGLELGLEYWPGWEVGVEWGLEILASEV